MNHDLVNHVADKIRRVDRNHTMGAGQLAEVFVAELGGLARFGDERVTDPVVDALVNDSPLKGSALTRDDLDVIARIVLRSLAEG